MYEVIIFDEIETKETGWLNDYFYKIDNKIKPIKLLPNISKINIFVGSNNSGKSRFMRKIFYNPSESSSIPRLFLNFEFDKLNPTSDFIESILRASYNDEVKRCFGEYKKIIENGDKNSYRKVLNSIFTKFYSRGNSSVNELIIRNLNEEVFNVNNNADRNRHYREVRNGIESSYIPVLRGMKPLYIKDMNKKPIENRIDSNYVSSASNAHYSFDDAELYYARIKKDYFKTLGNDSKEKIFTGLSIYGILVKHLLGDLEKRNLIKDYEQFLSEELFNNKLITIIPNVESDVVYIKIGNDKEQPIYNLGDGIQSLIILTFQMFVNKDKEMFFFIEEPEMFLHPEMQRKLLNIFKDARFDKHQFFLTTHSNHLIDMTADFEDISVYLFRKKDEEKSDNDECEPNFIIENVSPDEVEILNELGVKNSSVLLSNCTIWVEGITDRFYIREYLKIYQLCKFGKEKYREDKHFSFVEYSGNNITHWSFLDTEDENYSNISYEKITNKIFLIADKDSEGEELKKQKRFDKLKEKLGDNFYLLDCVEIENLLHEDIVKSVVYEYEGKIDKNIFKKPDFTNKEFKEIHLGRFIDDQLGEKKKRKYGKENTKEEGQSKGTGTITDKQKFAKKACKYMQDNIKVINECINSKPQIDNYLSEPAQKLIEKVIKFIEENNQ